MGIADFITAFIPDEDPEDTPEAYRRKMRSWRQRLALVSCSNFLFTFALLLPALIVLLFVGAPMIGQVAWANDQEIKINTKIAKANEPLAKEIAELKQVQQVQGKILRELATASTREQLCRYAARRMIERDVGERFRLLEQIDELKQRYTEYSGQIFDTADC